MDVISKAIHFCKKTEAWLLQLQSRTQPTVTASNYDTLAPKCIDEDNMQEYFRALKFALSKNEVRNIAITGNYGAGKSTVISSFMKYHSDKQYINVSLAGFEMAENENSPRVSNQQVELSILQQILYKENRDALPDSRIDRILNRSWLHTVKTYLSLLKVAVPTAVLCGILFFDTVTKWLKLPKEWSVSLNEHYIIKAFVMTGLALTSLFFLTQIASRIGIFDKKIRLGKIAFLSADLEFNEKEPSSLLNNCLDEIVYFFSRCPYEIVIFEDLDRLGTPEIFVKLREINKIINNNRKNKTPVRFIYAVRDDMFLDADGRTKFFDFILPIIPFMDSRNALTLLKNKTPSLSAVNDKHLKSIASYINDMRSLINIVNEFHTFSQVVDNSKISIKLFALVFYKNVYALDYHLADKKTGLLYSFIHNYRTQKLHSDYFESLDDELKKLSECTIRLEEEICNTSEDIRKDIITKLVPELLWEKVFIAAGIYHSRPDLFDSAELVRNEKYFLDAFTSRGKLYVGYNSPYNNGTNFVPIGDESQKYTITNYHKRVKLIGGDRKTKLQELNNKIYDLENKIRARNAIPLGELIRAGGRKKFEDTAHQYLAELEKHEFISKEQLQVLRTDMQYGGLDALYVLLSDGLIMQDFMSYRSIFHEGSMTVNDNDFIKAIGQDLGCEISNHSFYIDDEEKVISELIEQNRIYSDGALHHQLLTHIIATSNECFTDMIASLFNKSEQHIYKVFEILNIKFVKPEIFDEFVIRSLRISSYLERMFDILKANRELPFSKSISITALSLISPKKNEGKISFREYAHFLGSDIIRIIHHHDRLKGFLENIHKANVCYALLFTPHTQNEIFAIRYIAERNLYMITMENVSNVIYAYLADRIEISPDEARSKPWTLIHQYRLKPLISYYHDNIDTFVQNVLIYSDENNDSIRSILARVDLSDESKEIIIKKMNFTLPELSGLSSNSYFSDGVESLSLHDLLFHCNRIIPSWPVILEYITDACNKTILHQWLTKHANNLGHLNRIEYNETQLNSLYEKIICSDSFDQNTYIAILSSVEIVVEQIDRRLSLCNLTRLIIMKKIILNEHSYKIIENLYDNHNEELTKAYILWFSQFKDEFMSDPDFYLRRKEDMEFFETILKSLMLSIHFDDERKAQLVIVFSEYYINCDISDINIPDSVAILAIGLSNDIPLNALLLAVAISRGYRNKSRIAKLCEKINESDLANVFLKRTQATITATNINLTHLILKQSQNADIIKGFETREDGKITVNIKQNPGEDE